MRKNEGTFKNMDITYEITDEGYLFEIDFTKLINEKIKFKLKLEKTNYEGKDFNASGTFSW